MSVDSAPIQRWLRWLLEGRYRWGYFTSSTGRYGSEYLRVVIYPPDSPRILRRCAHLARFWLPVSAASTLGTASIVVTLVEISLLTASIGPAVLCLLAWIALKHVSAPMTRRQVTTSARKSTISLNLNDELRFDQVNGLLKRLRQAERQMDGGAISKREYQDRWAVAFAVW
ncbi:MAG TPA: DUF6611 family protein [Cryobacterium sp.]|nr:DUF6611 family protein [Cryobacterium sp.]